MSVKRELHRMSGVPRTPGEKTKLTGDGRREHYGSKEVTPSVGSAAAKERSDSKSRLFACIVDAVKNCKSRRNGQKEAARGTVSGINERRKPHFSCGCGAFATEAHNIGRLCR